MLLAAAGCGPAEERSPGDVAAPGESAGERLVVYTVNYPLAYFAERIGGELVEVVFPAPGDVDPAYWSPDAETVAAFQAADLVLLNGADYAKWVPRVSLPASKLVDTSALLGERLIPLEETVTHTHGPTGEHSHAGWAFTTWLDPTVALEQARAIRAAFVEALPRAEAEIDSRFEALQADLRALDMEQAAIFEQLAPARFLFSHPVYQYLIARYDLDARSVHWEPGEMPDEAAWAELEALLAERPATALIWEAEPLPEIRQRLEASGLGVVVYHPCANRPAEGDWLTVMRANQARLSTAGLG